VRPARDVVLSALLDDYPWLLQGVEDFHSQSSGRLGVPRDRTIPECVQTPADAVRGSQVSRGNILRHEQPSMLFSQCLV